MKLIASSNYGEQRMHAKGGPRIAAMSMAPSGGGLESVSFQADAMQSESVGEQKLYTLADPITLEDGESKQAVLTMADAVPVKQEYLADTGYYNERGSRGHEDAPKGAVRVRLRVTNDVASKLGTALPPGSVTVYEPDSSGSLQKTDSASIGHVAEGEDFVLALRNPSKDLKVTRVLIDWKQDPEPAPEPKRPASASPTPAEEKPAPAPRFREEHREIVVYNFKDKDVEVELAEMLPSRDVEYLSASEHFTDAAKKSGKVSVRVSAKGQTKLNYRIKYRI